MEIPRNRPEVINPETLEFGTVLLVDPDYESPGDGVEIYNRAPNAFRQIELVYMRTSDSLPERTWPNMSFHCRQNHTTYRIRGSLSNYEDLRTDNKGRIAEDSIVPEVIGQRYLVMEYLHHKKEEPTDVVIFAENITLLPKDLTQ